MGYERLALLGRLAGGVAHDLSNYFTVALVSLERAARRSREPAVQLDIAEAMAAIDAATRLSSYLLEHARGGNPQPVRVDLADLVKRTLDLVRAAIRVDVRVVLLASSDVPPIRGVAAELEQLVLNLVMNASDAMPEGGELHITVRGDGEASVILEVCDTGAGIGEQEPLRSSKPGRHGPGLGLGVVRSVAERHGAEVYLGPREGGGTRVTVVLRAA